jgi:hypothetical protein
VDIREVLDADRGEPLVSIDNAMNRSTFIVDFSEDHELRTEEC